MVYGQYTYKSGKPEVYNVKRYPASCVNPPDGVTSAEWIKTSLQDRLWFLNLCDAPGKPLPFIPIIDGELRRRFLADS